MNKKLLICTLFLITATFQIHVASAQHESGEINWSRVWSEDVFKEAKEKNKFVILDLEAVWCHWCHVMHEETYTKSDIIKIINEHYIPIRIDHDLRPDLANKYRRYGWPATIIFNSDGEEIVKRAGYIAPDRFKLLLNKIVEDPTPEKPAIKRGVRYSNSPNLTQDLQINLIANHVMSFDSELGGFNAAQKYLDRETVEYALLSSTDGNKVERNIAELTLMSSLKLIDPAWGGVYQYSTMGGWDYPHFEKLSFIQGEYMRVYAIAGRLTMDSAYINAAKDVHKYIKDFLSNGEGGYYTSQDADLVQGEHSREYFALNDAERRKLGIPRVDKNIYTNNNARIVLGLLELYKATNDKQYLDEALKSTNWLLKNRSVKPSLKEIFNWLVENPFNFNNFISKLKWMISNKSLHYAGFSHNQKDAVGPFLTDNVYMGLVFLELYELTNNKKWLFKSKLLANLFEAKFYGPVAGFSTIAKSCEICAEGDPTIRIDENVVVARFGSKLYKHTKDSKYKALAEYALKYLVTPEVALSTSTEPGILIAHREYLESLN